ncbi:MAG: DNRLRE domain-containing protein, partial [Bacillota bacterium]
MSVQRKSIIFLAVFMFFLLILSGLSGHHEAVSAAQVTLNPTDDTDTQSDVAAGTNAVLNASQWCHLFTRFSLTSISGNVTAATYRIYHQDHANAHTLNLCNVSTDNWSEGGTKPTLGSVITSKSVSANGYVDFDVTSLVAAEASGDDVISFGHSTNLGTWERYCSREGTYKPELVVTYESAAATPTPTPTNTPTNTPTPTPTPTQSSQPGTVTAKKTLNSLTIDGNLGET